MWVNRSLNSPGAIAWVKGHVGIPGNEKADRIAAAANKDVEGHTTFEGLRAMARKLNREGRVHVSYAYDRVTEWGRIAASTYKQCRVEAGPFNSWLNFIGKADTTECSFCGRNLQNGHLVFTCPTFSTLRQRLILLTRVWGLLSSFGSKS